MATGQNQNNMNPTERSNPEMMEGSTVASFSTPQMTNTSIPTQSLWMTNTSMASTLISTPQMTNTSIPNQALCMTKISMASASFSNSQMTNKFTPNQADQSQNCQSHRFGSGSGMHYQQTNQQFNQEANQNHSEIDDVELFLRYEEHSAPTNQHEINQACLNLADHSNSQFPTGGVRLSQQHQDGLLLPDHSNTLQSATGGVRLSQQHQDSLFLANHSNFVQSPTSGVRLSPQHQGGLLHSNSLQSLTGAVRLSQQHQRGLLHSNSLQSPTGGVRLSQQHQGGLLLPDHSNALQSTTGGVRLSQQHQDSLFLADNSNFVQSPTDGVRLPQQHQGGLLHSKSLQSPTSGVRLSQQHEGGLLLPDHSNALQSATGGVRLSQQHQDSLFLADNSNFVQSPTGGVRLSQQHQGGLLHSNSQQSPTGEVRLSQQHQGGLLLPDHFNSVQSPMSGVTLSQQHQGDQFQAGQSNSLQSAIGGVRLSQQPLNQAGQSHSDLSNPPQCTSGRMIRSEETRQPQWSQGEPSQDSRLKTSESGKTLTKKQISLKSDREYKQRERDKKKLSAEMFDKLKRGENVLPEDYRDRIPEPHRKLKSQQQIHQPSFFAPAVDHHGTDSGEVGQTGTGYEKIRNARKAMKEVSAAFNEIAQNRQNSTSWLQPSGPLPVQARKSINKQLQHSKFPAQTTMIAADHGSQTVFGGSQMSNDVQDPRMRASTSSSAAELPKKSKAPMSVEVVKTPQKRHRDVDVGPSTTPATSSKVTTPKSVTFSVDLSSKADNALDALVADKIFATLADRIKMNGTSYGVHHALFTLDHIIKVEEHTKQMERENSDLSRRLKEAEVEKEKAKAEVEELQAEVKRLNQKLGKDAATK